ncbi:MAG: cytochrome ubiquinol oxidase subunit I [Myxococcota bacterium]
MEDVLYARSQMALSLGFHIIFAAIGVALPLLMVISEALYHRTKNPVYLELTKRWAKGTAILFAVGAVSGTVLSFELGLLFPEFMEHAGAIIGTPFSLEGFAFFSEAIFLAIYLYGWDRISPRAHLWSGVGVAVSGAASAFFVVLANAWMNTPTGFRMVNGEAVDIDPIAAMFSPAAAHEVTHMLIACYLSTAALVAGVHAYYLLRDRDNPFHRKALAIALSVAAVSSVLQLVSGDLAAKAVAKLQPVKLAAMEGQFEDETSAPLRLFGIPDESRRTTDYAIEIPGALSFLAFSDFDAEVKGLNQFPEEDWPPVAVVHFAFQIMVFSGMLMLLVYGWGAVTALRRRALPTSTWFLRAVVAASPLGFIATEAGWVVTEVGRQPWIVYGIFRTADTVTPMPGLAGTFWTFTAVYILLAVAVVFLLRRQFRQAPAQ